MPLVPGHELDISSGSPQIYNAYDSMMTAEILGELKSLLPGANAPPELQGFQLIYDFERALQAPALEMMARGWCVDPMAREQGIHEIKTRLERLCLIIDCYVSAIAPGLRSPTKSKNKNNYPKPVCLNPDSTEQLQKFFYEIMKIPPRVTHKEGKESRPMDRDTLEHLDKYFLARPVVQAVLAYRDAAGQLEVMESQVDPDWRLRTSYNPAATTTGRWSSSESPTGSGRNIQNIEEDLRYWLIASPGKKLMGADYEQVESNDTAWYCGVLFDDWSLYENCKSGDPHVATSKLIWPELGWTGDATQDRKIADKIYYRHHSYRDIAKRARHGTEKGGQAPEIAKQIRVPLPLIREFQAKFFSAYPVLRQFFTWIAGQIQREKYLINSFGRRRDFFGRTDSTDTIKQAIAFMSQSATADRINLALWRIWKHSPELELLAQIHDAIYLERDETNTDEAECAEVFKTHLDVPLHFRNHTLSIRSEIKVGWRWANATKTNPDGAKTTVWPDGLMKFKNFDPRTRNGATR